MNEGLSAQIQTVPDDEGVVATDASDASPVGQAGDELAPNKWKTLEQLLSGQGLKASKSLGELVKVEKVFTEATRLPLGPIAESIGIVGEAFLQGYQEGDDAGFVVAHGSLLTQIEQVDPNFKATYAESYGPGGMMSLNDSEREQLIYSLQMELAYKLYTMKGDPQMLQLMTLDFLQKSTDAAYGDAIDLANKGELPASLSRNVAVGNYVDSTVRQDLRDFFAKYHLNEVPGIRVNSREYNTSEDDPTYRIPDSRVGNVAFDVTIATKLPNSPQIRGFFDSDFKPSAVVIVRPSQLGSYAILRPKGG